MNAYTCAGMTKKKMAARRPLSSTAPSAYFTAPQSVHSPTVPLRCITGRSAREAGPNLASRFQGATAPDQFVTAATIPAGAPRFRSPSRTAIAPVVPLVERRQVVENDRSRVGTAGENEPRKNIWTIIVMVAYLTVIGLAVVLIVGYLAISFDMGMNTENGYGNEVEHGTLPANTSGPSKRSTKPGNGARALATTGNSVSVRETGMEDAFTKADWTTASQSARELS